MIILSIDVGIKNLAICEIDAEQKKILNWQVINLCKDQELCNFITKKKVSCGKPAVYAKCNSLYCNAHAKKSTHIIPRDIPTCAMIKKLDEKALTQLTEKWNITSNKPKQIREIMQGNALVPIKPLNANTIELSELAHILCDELDNTLDLTHIDEVIIENQISPIANRMKCLQSMLTQYFAMRNIKTIKFISAANKLKLFEGAKKTYAERKKLGIEVTNNFLKDTNSPYIDMFNNSTKKDDLADAFLQGLAYLK